MRFKHLDATAARLEGLEGTVAFISHELVGTIRELTVSANELERRIVEMVSRLAPALLERRIGMGNTKTEAIRALKRKLSDVVFRALVADADTTISAALEQAA